MTTLKTELDAIAYRTLRELTDLLRELTPRNGPAPTFKRFETERMGTLDMTKVEVDLDDGESIVVTLYARHLTPSDLARAEEFANHVNHLLANLDGDGICTACGEHTTPGASCCGAPVAFEGGTISDDAVREKILDRVERERETPPHAVRYAIRHLIND